MDENNYRSTYHDINELPCVFEKAILQQCCSCHRTRHFNLAERIGVACTDQAAQKQCREFLGKMHDKSVFALQLPKTENGRLPHAKEIRIQCGCVIGLNQLENENESDIDIDQLLTHALDKASHLDNLPFDLIVRSVVKFKGRKRRKHE